LFDKIKFLSVKSKYVLHSCQTMKNAYVCENTTAPISTTPRNKVKNQSSFNYINEPRSTSDENQLATNYKQYIYHVPVAKFLHVDYRFRAYVEEEEESSSSQMDTLNADTNRNASSYICSLNSLNENSVKQSNPSISSSIKNQKPYRDYVFRFYRIC